MIADQQRPRSVGGHGQGHLAELREARKTRLSHADGDLDAGEATDEASWKEQLLDHLMAMAPAAFERLARRLLREADFDSVNVTGKSGDGGIDGPGVYRLGLVSSRPLSPRLPSRRGSRGPRPDRWPLGGVRPGAETQSPDALHSIIVQG